MNSKIVKPQDLPLEKFSLKNNGNENNEFKDSKA